MYSDADFNNLVESFEEFYSIIKEIDNFLFGKSRDETIKNINVLRSRLICAYNILYPDDTGRFL